MQPPRPAQCEPSYTGAAAAATAAETSAVWAIGQGGIDTWEQGFCALWGAPKNRALAPALACAGTPPLVAGATRKPSLPWTVFFLWSRNQNPARLVLSFQTRRGDRGICPSPPFLISPPECLPRGGERWTRLRPREISRFVFLQAAGGATGNRICGNPIAIVARTEMCMIRAPLELADPPSGPHVFCSPVIRGSWTELPHVSSPRRSAGPLKILGAGATVEIKIR